MKKFAFSKLVDKLFEIFNPASISHQRLVAIEINSDVIKLLKIHRVDHEITIRFIDCIPLPDGVVVKDEIKDLDEVARLLKEKFLQLNIPTRNVAVAVPRSFAIIKYMTVDKRLTPDEIESRVWVEADRLFPNLIKNICLDFTIVGPAPGNETELEIILIACRKEQIAQYMEVMKRADLEIKIIDVNTYALERALSLITPQIADLQTVALLNITYTLITLVVISEGKMIYSYELNYVGHGLVCEIDEGETVKKNLSPHIRHTMQFFYSSRPNIRIEKMVLSGDCVANIPDLAQFIQQETNKQITVADPFKNLKMASTVSMDAETLQKNGPSFMLCCGLAMSKPN